MPIVPAEVTEASARELSDLAQAGGWKPPKLGRPTDFSRDIAGEICRRFAGGETLKAICATEGFPDPATVWRWRNANEDFRKDYERAREPHAEAMADEIVEISDDGTNDWMEQRDRAGEITGYSVNGEAIARSKLRVDTRKWRAAKYAPKQFGDKTDLSVSGSLDLRALVLAAREMVEKPPASAAIEQTD